MNDIYVPCILNKKPVLLLTRCENGHIPNNINRPWEPPNIHQHVNDYSPWFKRIFKQIEGYFRETFKRAGNKDIILTPWNDAGKELVDKSGEFPLDEDNISLFLGIFLAAIQNILDLKIKPEWHSVTATGTFDDKKASLVLEQIGDYKPVPEESGKIDKSDKYNGFLNYVKENEETNENKCPKGNQYLYLYVNNDKELEKKSAGNIRIKSFSPDNNTLFDILDFVFELDLDKITECLIHRKKGYFFDFVSKTTRIEKKETLVQNIKELSEKLDKNSLFIYGPPGSGRSCLAFQLAQSLFFNGINYNPVWIKIKTDDEAPKTAGEYYEKIKGELAASFLKNRIDITIEDTDFFFIDILGSKQFLIIIDSMNLEGKELDDFLERMKYFLNKKKNRSRFIFINTTGYNGEKDNLESVKMPQKTSEPNEKPDSSNELEKSLHKISLIKRKIQVWRTIFLTAVVMFLLLFLWIYLKQKKDTDKIDFVIVNNVEELSAYLTAQPENTEVNPYNVILKGTNIENIREILKTNDTKFVNLDLSECTIADIEEYTFYYCNNLVGITVPNSVTNIRDNAFYSCENLTNVTIPAGVTSIGDSFYSCTSLTSITIPKDVTNIGNYAFQDCTGLTTINVDTANTSYSSYNGVLYNKAKTVLMIYPEGKTGAFTVPNSVIRIENKAFRGCTGLTSITIPGSVTNITSIPVDYNEDILDYNFHSCTSLVAINVDVANKVYSSENGVLFNKNKTVLIMYPRGKTGSYTIPDSVTGIENYAFSYCNNLVGIIIPNSVINIGANSFIWCRSLTSVTIPDSVTGIGNSAFSNCTGLSEATIGNSIKNIEDFVFCDCSNLSRVTIGNSVKSIGEYAFAYCTLLFSVTIPNNVNSIKKHAFYRCTNLFEVKISNSVNSIGDYAFDSCNSLISVTFKGTITSDNFGYSSFPGDLHEEYLALGMGKYTRKTDSGTWEKER